MKLSEELKNFFNDSVVWDAVLIEHEKIADELVGKVSELEQQIERLKRCENCDHRIFTNQIDGYQCELGKRLVVCSKWTMEKVKK